MITRQEMEHWKPNQEQTRMAELVFLQMAYVETIKPKVQDIQKRVLEKHQFKVKDEWKDRRYGIGPEIVLEEKHTYLMSDEDFKTYHNECRIEEDKIGLTVDHPDKCPLLVAEELLRQAQNELIISFKPVHGLELSQINMGLDIRKRILDLLLTMMAQHVNTKAVLQRLEQEEHKISIKERMELNYPKGFPYR